MTEEQLSYVEHFFYYLVAANGEPVRIGLIPFSLGSRKDKANKLAEEACEAYSAWEDFENNDDETTRYLLEHLCEECVDVMQAALNLMMSCGASEADIDSAVGTVTLNNFKRGRYKKL